MAGPLHGISIVELAGIGPAPFCAMMFADLGADVIRIERMTHASGEAGLLGEGILTRGRSSVAIDLKHPQGIALARDLIGDADGLIESYRPGVMERLGLGPEPCIERNPRLVYGRLTGYGQDGPLAPRAGHDIDYIALAGALDPIGEPGRPPVPPLNLVADFGGGAMVLATGMLAALLEAARSGVGQVVDAAMLDGSAYLMTMMFELAARGLWSEQRGSNFNDGGAPFYCTYATADGEHVAVGAIEPKFWRMLIDELDLAGEKLPDQWDRSGWPELQARLAEVFATGTREEWVARFEDSDACVEPVLRMSEAPLHPHAAQRGTFTEIDGHPMPAPVPRFSRSTTSAAGADGVPDGDAALRSRGVSPSRIAALRAEGTID